MRNTFTLSLLALMVFASLRLSAQVPNGDFETWTLGNPDGWFVSNIPGWGIPVTQSSPGHNSGSAAMGQPVIVVATGDTVSPSIISGTPGSGIPISQAYANLEFYYQCNLTGGDLFSIDVFIYDASNTIIAASNIDISANAGSWTYHSLAINYFGSGIASTATILFNLLPDPNNGQGYPNPGSSFLVDDVSLSGVAGVKDFSTVHSLAVAYPSPSKDFVTIIIADAPVGHSDIVVFDLLGNPVKKISSFTNGGASFEQKFTIAELPTGVYIARITSGNKQWIAKIVRE
jgi:hypothetical protein